MEIRILRYFLTVATEQSITQAARVLHITQPTLSRQIKELEEKLGTPLFIRKNKKMLLTEAGMFLKSRAEEMVLLSDKTEQVFLERKQEVVSGHIAIGCVEADNSDTLAMFLEEMVAEYPQVSFSIFSGTSDEIVEKLDRGLLDIALLLEPISTEKFNKIILPRQEKWGLLVSKDFFLANRNCVTIDELMGIPLLCPSRVDVQKMLYARLKLEVGELTIIGTFNLIFNVFSLVENGVGSALTIEGAVSNRRLENMKFLPLMPEIKINCVVVWKKNTVISPAVHKLIEKFKHAF
ncbi:LysR family transcriptional regulator [Lysinibacillus piscis]|uniref:LysR family transcriptional regulator n=1 Tax=Lysinibacillus piscis TaxID=2518931 RepID=A0ABQ5NFY7_9BACI|nr:LysR family transcriptional regulator [Lysinibacillus sp. KH24]GLC87173.1 LysR family transcriptional regulator [Lysinibacillus sp. KH24]